MNWKIISCLTVLCVSISAIGFIFIGELDLADEWRVLLFLIVLLSIGGIFVFAQQGTPDKEGMPVGTTMFYPAKKLIAWKIQTGLVLGFLIHCIGLFVLGTVVMVTLIIPAMLTGWWRDSNLRHHSPLWGNIKYGVCSIALFCMMMTMMVSTLIIGVFSKKNRDLLKI